jgi:hypothetical protein
VGKLGGIDAGVFRVEFVGQDGCRAVEGPRAGGDEGRPPALNDVTDSRYVMAANCGEDVEVSGLEGAAPRLDWNLEHRHMTEAGDPVPPKADQAGGRRLVVGKSVPEFGEASAAVREVGFPDPAGVVNGQEDVRYGNGSGDRTPQDGVVEDVGHRGAEPQDMACLRRGGRGFQVVFRRETQASNTEASAHGGQGTDGRGVRRGRCGVILGARDVDVVAELADQPS